MPELMILLSVALTAFAAIGGVAHGIRAVQLSRNHLDRSGLHLAALNLLEPSVTIGTLLAVGFATNAFDSSEASPLVLIAGIPLTFMLLAPLFTPAAASRGGGLRLFALGQHRGAVGCCVDGRWRVSIS